MPSQRVQTLHTSRHAPGRDTRDFGYWLKLQLFGHAITIGDIRLMRSQVGGSLPFVHGQSILQIGHYPGSLQRRERSGSPWVS